MTVFNARAASLTGDHTTTAATLTKTGARSSEIAEAAELVATSSSGSSWTDGPICLQTGGILRVTGSLASRRGHARLQLPGAGTLFDIDAGGTVTVAGTSQVRAWNAPLEIDGTLDIDGSAITLNNAGPNTHAGTSTSPPPARSPSPPPRPSPAPPVGGPGTWGSPPATSTVADGGTLDPATLNLAGGSLALDGTAPATTSRRSITGGAFTGTRNRSVTALNALNGGR